MYKHPSQVISIVLAVVLILSVGAAAFAAGSQEMFSKVNILFNGNQIAKKGENITLPNGASAPSSITYTDEKGGDTTYLPVRKLSEMLGVPVDYSGATQSVLVGKAASNVYDGGTGTPLKGGSVTVETKKDGAIYYYTLKNGSGMEVILVNRGATIWSVLVPDKDGKMADVVLDRTDPEKNGVFGTTTGRNANRIANAAFKIDGVPYQLVANNGPNNLHSNTGNRTPGLSGRYFEGEVKQYSNVPVVEFSLYLDETQDDFPGDLTLKVSYALTDDNAIVQSYWAVSNKDTVINMTNHSYFNLAGHDSGNIFGHQLWINADFYTPFNKVQIPTGEIAPVKGTPMDFTKIRPIYGREVAKPTPGETNSFGFAQIDLGNGYDNNYVLNGAGYRKVATLYDPASKRAMDVFTTERGLQFFTANGTNIDAELTKSGVAYRPYCSVALETQNFPDAINQPWFPSPIVRTGTSYNTTTTFQFYVK